MNQTPASFKASKKIAVRVVAAFSLLFPLVALQGTASAESDYVPTASVCGEHGKDIVRLYRAYFNRYPDAKGLNYWGGIYNQTDIHNVAYWMSQSPEFQNRWNGTSARDYVELSLYRNLLDRPSDEKGLNYWDDTVADIGRDKVALFWVQTPELVKKHPVNNAPGCGTSSGPDTYEFRTIPGGKVVDVNYYNVDLKASTNRCSVASINANWLYLSNSQPIGMAVVDGQILNSNDRQDRGIFGERIWNSGDPGPGVVDDWSGDVMTDNIFQKPGVNLEHHFDYYTTSAQGWRWAVSGISLITGGDVSSNLTPTVLSDYTHGTFRHSFIATKPDGTLTFGSTTGMNVSQLISWAQAQGYDNLIKMDGGGSVEFNIGGQVAVAGTGRDIPVWFGIGC